MFSPAIGIWVHFRTCAMICQLSQQAEIVVRYNVYRISGQVGQTSFVSVVCALSRYLSVSVILQYDMSEYFVTLFLWRTLTPPMHGLGCLEKFYIVFPLCTKIPAIRTSEIQDFRIHGRSSTGNVRVAFFLPSGVANNTCICRHTEFRNGIGRWDLPLKADKGFIVSDKTKYALASLWMAQGHIDPRRTLRTCCQDAELF